MSESYPITMWYSTFGAGDGHDFATRGYLRALMHVDYVGLRMPPALASALLNVSDSESQWITPLVQPPNKLKPLIRVQAGDPRIGTERVFNYIDSANGETYEGRFSIVEGSVDPDVEQETSANFQTHTEAIVIHHDPSNTCRIFGALIELDRPEDVAFVGISVWETSHLPDPVAKVLSELDLIIVPSRFVADALERSGVDTKISVIPHTFDAEAWPRPTIKELAPRNDDRFIFNFIGTPIERKNIKGLIKAFCCAFAGRKDVVLRVKSMNEASLKKMRDAAIEASGIASSEVPDIQLFWDKWPIKKMRAFHLASDCFVSATRGEGFGLCEFEAKLCGNRVITTDFGAAPEICSQNDIVVGCNEVEVFGMEGIGPYEVDQLWADPDEEALVAAMQRAAKEMIPKSVHEWDMFHAIHGPGVVGKQLANNLKDIRREVRDE